MNLALQRVFVFVILALLQCGAKEGDSNLCAYRNVHITPPPGGASSPSSSSSKSSSSDEMFWKWGMEVLDDNVTVRCHGNIYCFTLWKSDTHNKSKINVLQGCWIGEANVCKEGACVSSMAPKNNSHFCCCSGDMCNLNFTDVYDPTAHTTSAPVLPPAGRQPQDRSYKIKTVIISLVSVFSVALVIIVAYFGYRMCMRPKHPSIESLHVPESPPVQPEFDMDDLKLCNILSKGRYAEVWKGKLENRDVAVKVYSPHYREYYNNERTLYRLPFMDHEGLIKFYGADERITQEGSAQLMVVMLYVPLGSLNSYLKNNTVDWPTMVRMAYSVARALSHLHTDIQKGDQFKPVLAHRDLNTRNILVKSDLSCVVSDLGFAVATMGSKLIKKGHAEVAEQTSLTDVGTLRYMAPELLDGAVNLRDCEASLKQIDIYAMGLVLWEIAMRCVDLYQGAPVPEYVPPFQTEIGSSPTFEEMQLMVVRAKKRPKFPEVWKETNQAVRSLKETIEECWDADAEARLTALCVEERLSDLPNLWAHEIKHRGMTPTLNAMINITETTTATTTTADHTTTTTVIANGDPSQPIDASLSHGVHDGDDITTSSTAPLMLGNGHARGGDLERSPSVSLTHSWLQDPSVSTGTTDTMLPITPAESSAAGGGGIGGAPLQPKASNLLQERNSTVLRPHTGRNPTVERNTHKRSDEELRVSGNTLVSSAFHERRDSLSTQSAPIEQPTAESPPDYLSDGPETSLVQNDALSHRNPPIPYLQNQVHSGSGGLAGRPKVANTGPLRSYPRGERSFREKLSRLIRPRELGLKLSGWNFFGNGRRHDYSRADDMEVEDLNQETAVAEYVQPIMRAAGLTQGPFHPSADQQAIHTEVCLQNGSAITRPTNLTLPAHSNIREALRPSSNLGILMRDPNPRAPAGEDLNVREASREVSRGGGEESLRLESCSGSSTHERSTSREVSEGSMSAARDSQSEGTDEVFTAPSDSHPPKETQPLKYPENRLRFAEVGVAKLHLPTASQRPVLRVQGHSKSTSELLHLRHSNPNSDSCWQETELSSCGGERVQRRRPNSLSLKGHNYSPALKPQQTKKFLKTDSAGAHKKQMHERSQRSRRATSVEEVTLDEAMVQPQLDLMEAGEKIRRRVKTPVRPSKKMSRLSLYDDRLMSQETGKGAKPYEGVGQIEEGELTLRKSSTSSKLSHNGSVEDSGRRAGQEKHGSMALSTHDALPFHGASAMCVSDSDIVV